MQRIFRKIKRKGNQWGVALLMVLASLALLSGMVVEFAYNSNITYNLAMNDLDRVQAYYLAQSGINFGKLLLKFEQEARKVAKDASSRMGRDIQVPPLYEMIPINTELFRGLSEMGAGGALGTEGGGEEGGGSMLEQGLGMIDLGGAEDFLSFKGDFSVEFSEEDAKLNLNSFFVLATTDTAYDQMKNILYHVLTMEDFEGLFADRYRGAKDLAQNIADFIDKDEVHNEPGGNERGREGVGGDGSRKMKNGKLISFEELTQVPEMSEEVLQKLKKYVTLYGTDQKINVCRAPEPLVKAMIIAYSESHPNIAPLKSEGQELLDKALETVMTSCPNTAMMSTELNNVLGVAPSETGSEGSVNTRTVTKEGQRSVADDSQQKSTSQSFGDLVKDSSTVYALTGIGTVGESEVKLKTVIDISQGDAAKWKEIYWRIE